MKTKADVIGGTQAVATAKEKQGWRTTIESLTMLRAIEIVDTDYDPDSAAWEADGAIRHIRNLLKVLADREEPVEAEVASGSR